MLVVPGLPLVTSGPYRWLRHPNYVGVVGELIAMALMTRARLSGPLGTLFFVWLLFRRMAAEERAMELYSREGGPDRPACTKPACTAVRSRLTVRFDTAADLPDPTRKELGLERTCRMTSMTERPSSMTFRRACTVCALVLLAAVQVPLAQSRPPAAATPADAALRALNAGQYDEVDRLLRAATDARSVAIRARGEIARGRYAEAEKLLTPVAVRSTRQ